MKAMAQLIDPLIGSVLRNSEAMAALIRIKAKGDYLFNHSIANAVWASVLGRQLGLPRDQLKRLALGAALVDVGMTQLDDSLISSLEPLTALGREEVRRHVSAGVALLNGPEAVHSEVTEVVLGHHERFDGSGYPGGLIGLKGELFQTELVEQFMQAIGLFPTGCVVELNTGEVGVVVAPGKYALHEDGHTDLWINRELEVGAHGIKPDEFLL